MGSGDTFDLSPPLGHKQGLHLSREIPLRWECGEAMEEPAACIQTTCLPVRVLKGKERERERERERENTSVHSFTHKRGERIAT